MVIGITDSFKKLAWIAGIVFVILTVLVGLRIGFLDAIDKSINNLFNGWETTFGDSVMVLISALGSPLAGALYAIVLGAFLYISNLRIPAIWVVSTYIIGAVFIETILKIIIQRPRPMMHSATDSGYSFPSGHMAAISIIAAILFVIIIPNLTKGTARNWLTWGLITFVLLVAESRIYVQAHYLSDVIAGGCFGVVWTAIAVWLYQRFAPQLLQFDLFQYDQI